MILFNISGADFDAKKFMCENNIADFDIWEKGQLRRYSNKVYEDSGISKVFSEAKNPVEAIKLIKYFLVENCHWLEILDNYLVEKKILIGVNVGSFESYIPVLEFDQEILHLLVRCCINLQVSSYPTSNE